MIVGIISSIAALIILEGMKASSKEQNLSDAHYQARLAMERMAREIRMINSQGNVGTVPMDDNRQPHEQPYFLGPDRQKHYNFSLPDRP